MTEPWWFYVVYALGMAALAASVLWACFSFDRDFSERYGVPSIFDPDQRPLNQRDSSTSHREGEDG